MKNNELNKKFNIPTWVKGNTPAEEAASVQKRFKDRKDKASVETMEEILGSIRDKQEFFKAQQEATTQSNQYDGGGLLDMYQPKAQTPSTTATNTGGNGALQVAGQAAGAAGQFTPTPSLPEGSHSDSEQVNQTMNKVKDVSAGFNIFAGAARTGEKYAVNTAEKTHGPEGATFAQAAFSPSDTWSKAATDKDMSTGNRIGAIASSLLFPAGAAAFLNPSMDKRRSEHSVKRTAEGNQAIMKTMGNPEEDMMASMQAAMGGYQTKNNYAGGGYPSLFDNFDRGKVKKNPEPVDPWVVKDKGNMTDVEAGQVPTYPNFFERNPPLAQENIENVVAQDNVVEKTTNGDPSKFSKFGKWAGKNWTEGLALAPLVGSLTNKIDRAKDPRRDRMIGSYDPTYVDEARVQKQIAQATRGNQNAIRDTAGGSQGRLMAGLLSSGLAGANAVGAGAVATHTANAAERAKVQEYQFLQDKMNIGQTNLDEADAQANAGAYETSKSANRAAIFEDAGKFGRELGDKKIVKSMFGYTWNGDYDKNGVKVWKDKKGNVKTQAELEAMAKEAGKTE